MSYEQQISTWHTPPPLEINTLKHAKETPVRKQRLMRCGRRFYMVYDDDGSLVEDQNQI